MTKHIHQKEFKRVETKYLVSLDQLPHLLSDLGKHMEADDFAQSTITSLYFDTDHFDMIQDSLAKKYGKEKIRLRTYDDKPQPNSSAFLEIKQKREGIGYKYRVKTTPHKASSQLLNHKKQTQADDRLTEQLQQLQDRYGSIGPRMLIRYNRLALKGKKQSGIRITIDTKLDYTPVNDLILSPTHSFPLLPQNQLIMEIKVDEHMPTWLQAILDTYHLEKTAFSKYGKAYQLYKKRILAKEDYYA